MMKFLLPDHPSGESPVFVKIFAMLSCFSGWDGKTKASQ